MAGNSEIRSLAQRKHALVEESELYRQTLKLQFANLRTSGTGLRRRFGLLKALGVISLAAPLVGPLLGIRAGERREKEKKKARGWRRALGGVALGWRIYRGLGPWLAQLAPRRHRS